MNSINIVGRFTADPTLRYTQTNNTAVCSFSIAVDDGFGDKKKTYFFTCQAWGKTAESISKFFNKGDLIAITGRLATRDWTDKDGKKHTVTEIIVGDFSFYGGKKKSDGEQGISAPASSGGGVLDAADLNDDELPF